VYVILEEKFLQIFITLSQVRLVDVYAMCLTRFFSFFSLSAFLLLYVALHCIILCCTA